jgi:proline iminopeptidase
MVVFGGSWGATLALAYAETWPERVEGLVLRGVFTATQAEIDHFYHGGVRKFFPGVYDRFVGALPDPGRRPIPAYLNELLHSDDPEVCAKYADVWARYEIRISALDLPDEQVDALMETFDPLAFARMENFYMTHNCFLEEGQLLQNAERLGGVRVVMVNGRYDVVCPPVTAYRLQRALPDSELILAEGSGHWMGEPAIEKALVEAVSSFE